MTTVNSEIGNFLANVMRDTKEEWIPVLPCQIVAAINIVEKSCQAYDSKKKNATRAEALASTRASESRKGIAAIKFLGNSRICITGCKAIMLL